ncbi:MAG: response regulator [Anaerolineae bacterium]|nr:response regulator [Anaerolineae bacterium]NIN95772.1 response regulator [Anaerolineae bacterium]NIQ78747.1 response regulator [Anaerolineae bacterium]
MTDRRILVVDDEESVVLTCVDELVEEGFRVQAVTDGAKAIELYKREHFDLVLADLKVAGVDGMGVLRAIMEYDPEARVVIMTAYGTVDIAVEALRTGAREFISKPFDMDALVGKLRSVLEQQTDEAVRGNLRDLGLASIISVNCNEMNQAKLVVRRKGRVGTIHFDGGTIVHATLDDEEGDRVIYELLSWEDGRFSLEQGVPPPKRTIEADWTGLVLEAMRRIDEGAGEWDLGWDEDEVKQEENMDRIAKALEALEGIDGVVICSKGGEVLGRATEGDAIRRAMLTAFIGRRAETLGALVHGDELRQVALASDGRSTIIVPYGQNYAGLSLVERTSAESVTEGIQTVLRRYRQG